MICQWRAEQNKKADIEFRIRQNFNKVFVQNFCRRFSHCLSANHNPDLRCVICTGVTLFVPVLHFLHLCYTYTALLSANRNRVLEFFHVYY